MKRLTDMQLKNIKKLMNEGKSLKKISKILNLSKTTVYYHFRKIKGRTIIQPAIHFPSERILGEVVGIFSGDGSLSFVPVNYGYTVRIHSSIYNFDYLIYVKKLFEKCFGTKFALCKYKSKRFIEKKSKSIYNFFFNYIDFSPKDKAHTVKLRDELSNEFKGGFLKGLFDTDGTFFKDEKRSGRIMMSYFTSSKELAKQLKDIIKGFGFECNISEDKRCGCNSIFIYKNSVMKFAKFLNSYKTNKRMKLWAGRSTGRSLSRQSNRNGRGFGTSLVACYRCENSNPDQSTFSIIQH